MGLDPFEADPRPCSPRGAGLTAPYVIYCGRREPLKGTPLLLDYWAPSGSGPAATSSWWSPAAGRSTAARAAPHVVDLGFVSEQEKHEAMAGAVAFCHPSVNESLSIVLLEAWLARTPALVHARGAVTRFHCEQGNGGLWCLALPRI